MFFTYNQNNSGGSFDFDEKKGITHWVIVEADSAEQADERAVEIGLYFNGCDTGMDCDCCGDRWYALSGAYQEEGHEVPTIYGKPLIEVGSEADKSRVTYFRPTRWMGNNQDVFVHLKDGRIYGFVLIENRQYVYDGKRDDLVEAMPAASTKALP